MATKTQCFNGNSFCINDADLFNEYSVGYGNVTARN